jgi:hypothetical protein
MIKRFSLEAATGTIAIFGFATLFEKWQFSRKPMLQFL